LDDKRAREFGQFAGDREGTKGVGPQGKVRAVLFDRAHGNDHQWLIFGHPFLKSAPGEFVQHNLLLCQQMSLLLVGVA